MATCRHRHRFKSKLSIDVQRWCQLGVGKQFNRVNVPAPAFRKEELHELLSKSLRLTVLSHSHFVELNHAKPHRCECKRCHHFAVEQPKKDGSALVQNCLFGMPEHFQIVGLKQKIGFEPSPIQFIECLLVFLVERNNDQFWRMRGWSHLPWLVGHSNVIGHRVWMEVDSSGF